MTWESERAEFHEERRTMIGGSDAAAIMGLSRWRTAMDVWADKVGLTSHDDEQMRLRQWIGLRLEPLLAEMATARLGRKFRRKHGTIRSRQFHFIGGHVDYVGLEVKTSYSAEGWGEDGTPVVPDDEGSWDAVPIDYLLQVQHYLYVTRWPTMAIAVLIGHDDFRTYDVKPLPRLIVPMIDEEVRFWQEYVVTGAPPPLDASEGTKAYLRSRFPRAMGVLRTASPDETLLIDEVRRATAAAAEADKEAARLSSILKGRIGNDTGIAAPGVTATWPSIKRKPEVNWEAIAAAYRSMINDVREVAPDLLPDLDLDVVESLHTGQPTTYRRLNIAHSRR